MRSSSGADEGDISDMRGTIGRLQSEVDELKLVITVLMGLIVDEDGAELPGKNPGRMGIELPEFERLPFT